MEDNNIMENEVEVIENETGIVDQNDNSDVGLIALIAGGLVAGGAMLHKFVLQPIGKKFKAWRASKKAQKDFVEDDDFIDPDEEDLNEET